MPIINYDDYYKPNKPQPKAPTKYYQPPKPKAAPPQKYTDYSQGRYGAAYTPPKDAGMNFFQQMMDRINSALMNQVNSLPPQTYPTKINEPKISLQNLRNTTQQPNWNPNTPIGNTLASSYNYDYKADNPAYWSPNPLYGKRWITQNYVDELGQQRTRSVYVTYPEPPASPWLSTTPVPGAYVNPYAQAGAAPAYTNYSHGRYANPARMGGTSGITRMTDTGGAGAGAGNNPGQRSSPTFVPTTRMSDDRAWQNSRARTGDAIRPQDYFMRTVLNGIGYSIPNQMLNFTDTGGVSADWAQTPRWYEPPAGYTTSGAGWKESIGKPWGLQDVTDNGTFEPVGGGGYGGYGYGGGGGDYYSLPSMPGYRGYADGGYYSMPGSPNYKGYSGGGIRMPGSPQYTGRNSSGYGASSNVSGYANAVGAGGYGSNGNAPSYVGRGAGGRGSSYAGAQSMNQATWRMPMLVWNI